MPRVPKEVSFQRQLTALQLRLAGRTYEEIRQAIGYASASAAYGAVMSAMKKTLREPADEIRTIELDRIDKALASIWPAVLKGHLGSIAAFVKLSEHRSKIVGLYAPTKTTITGVDSGPVRLIVEYAEKKQETENAGL